MFSEVKLFKITLTFFLVMMLLASYYRFFVIHDYKISYEATCNPEINSCFIGCSDDECSENYFYARIEKRATDLINECGNTVINCRSANTCLSTDEDCSISYCANDDINSNCSQPKITSLNEELNTETLDLIYSQENNL